MAPQTGRTVSKWIDFRVDDSGGTLRSIPISSLSAVGVTYATNDLTAFQDAVMGMLPNMPSAPIDITGPVDNSAAQAAGTLSGSHTVLSAINGLSVPLSLDIQFGIRHAWEAGEPQFGITSSSTSGYLCTSYNINPDDMTYNAHFELYPGSALPAFGTAAEA